MENLDKLLISLEKSGNATIIESVDPIGVLFNYFILSKKLLLELSAKTTLIPFILDYTKPEIYNKLQITLEEATEIQNVNKQLITFHKLMLQFCMQQYVFTSITKQLYDDIIKQIPEGNMDYLINFIKNYEEGMQKMQTGGGFGQLFQIITGALLLITNITTFTAAEPSMDMVTSTFYEQSAEDFSEGRAMMVPLAAQDALSTRYDLSQAINVRSEMYKKESWYGAVTEFAESKGLPVGQAQREIDNGIQKLDKLLSDFSDQGIRSCNMLARDIFNSEYYKEGMYDKLYERVFTNRQLLEEESIYKIETKTKTTPSFSKRSEIEFEKMFDFVCQESYSVGFKMENNQLIMSGSNFDLTYVRNFWDVVSEQFATLKSKAKTSSLMNIYDDLSERAEQHKIIMRQISTILDIPSLIINQKTREKIIPKLLSALEEQLEYFEYEIQLSTKKMPITDRHQQLAQIVADVKKEQNKREAAIDAQYSTVSYLSNYFSGYSKEIGKSLGEAAASPFVGVLTGIVGDDNLWVIPQVIGLGIVVLFGVSASIRSKAYKMAKTATGFIVSTVVPYAVVSYYLSSPQLAAMAGASGFILLQNYRSTPDGDVLENTRVIVVSGPNDAVPRQITSGPTSPPTTVRQITSGPSDEGVGSQVESVRARAENLQSIRASNADDYRSIIRRANKIITDAQTIMQRTQDNASARSIAEEAFDIASDTKASAEASLRDMGISSGGRKHKTRKNKVRKTRKLKVGKRRNTRHRNMRPTKRR
jgi:hypothetical protein